MSKFEINKSVDWQFYFEFVANNGQTVAVSETYTTKQNCKHWISVLQDEAWLAEIKDNT